MPVEIKELIIKAFIGSDEDKSSDPKKKKNDSCGKTPKNESVDESINQMLYLIKNKNER